MTFNNKTYDLLKWVALVFMPALTVLVAGLGEVYRWGNVAHLTASLNLLTVFLGSVLQLSSYQYNSEER